MLKKNIGFGLLLLSLAGMPLESLNISEKRQSLQSSPAGGQAADGESLSQINRSLQEKRANLQKLYFVSQEIYTQALADKASDEALEKIFKEHQEKIVTLRHEIKALEDKWKSVSEEAQETEQEGLWHQPDTTIGQLVIDYGTYDFIYLMPPEIAGLKVHVSSQLSVPRAMWSEMLELILANSGIGIKQLNPFLRQLIFLRLNQSDLVAITDNVHELKLISPDSRVCFVLQPPATELRRIFQFLERFSPQEQMNLQVLGHSIVMVGYAREVSELLKIYDFISLPKHQQEYKLLTLQKGQSEEVAKILQSIFDGGGSSFISDSHDGGKDGAHFTGGDTGSGFRILTLKAAAQSLFMIGKTEQLEKATKIVEDIEKSLGEVQDKMVHWYACKHSEAEELADVLGQVYNKMMSSPDAFALKGMKKSNGSTKNVNIKETVNSSDNSPDRLVVSPPKIKPDSSSEKKRSFEKNENFIVDPKTNSIVMVVEGSVLPKLRELIKKLDVPKKMVQIDVLLFEKRVADNNTFGLNLLRMGQAASDKHVRSLTWNKGSHHKKKHRKHHKDRDDDRDERSPDQKGILQFLISRGAHGAIPAYDLAYNFLLAQEDISINANPTVTTVNQTPAKIAIVEQISVNTGVVEIDTTKATRLKDSYSREEYGIIISITPTIHAKTEDEEEPNAPKFIHLSTDLVFDTTRPSKDNRPDVTRRNIKNEVRVADGETVILGGLRRKIASDNAEMVPFLGELPGVGKLFGITSMEDSSTEMFIFLTPRIVPDKSDEFRKMRHEAIMVRPGDVPEFLQELEEARKKEKRKIFEGSIKLLLGRPDNSFLGT